MDEIVYELLPFFIGVLFVYLGFLFYKHMNKKDDISEASVAETNGTSKKAAEEESVPKISAKAEKAALMKKKGSKDTFAHPWLMTSLKGHTGTVQDMEFSSNGKFFTTCAADRSVLFYNVKTFADKIHKSNRANIEYDYAKRIKWSPDGKAFIVCLASGNTIQVHRVAKKPDGSLGNFEIIHTYPVHHTTDIIDIGLACNGHFIMSCSVDTTIVVWNLKGEKLDVIDTHHINNYYACVSPCGRFIASAGFTPDVRVWEVCFTKTGEFKEVKRAFELKGHTSGVYHFSFNNDSSRMVTVSKDGTWKYWDTNVQYQMGQEPYLLKSCTHQIPAHCKTALSPDGRTIALAPITACDIYIYSALNGQLQAEIKDIHPDLIQSIVFSPDGHYLLAAVGRYVRVFYNIPGYKNVILALEDAKKAATNNSTRDRLQTQIDDAKHTLSSLEKK